MRNHNRILRPAGTAYLTLDTGKCRACWKCIESCPNGVIGRIDLFFHRHIGIERPERCKGCLKCVSACERSAIIAQPPKTGTRA